MRKFSAVNHPHGTPAFLPLYQQIKLLIIQSLVSGEWRPGTVIPSELELAARYRVSQGTVRKAINELAGENLLIRHQGKGTFVASHAEENRRFYFTRIAADRGGRELPVAEVTHFGRGKADSRTARLLDLSSGAAILVIRRVLRMSGQPVIFEEVRLPAALFKGLTPAVLAERGSLLYSTYESALGVRVLRANEEIKAVAADAATARALGIASGAPLLQVERVALTYGNKPVELRRSFWNTAEYHYRAQIV